MDPIISYEVKRSSLENFVETDNYYGGTITKENSVEVDIRIWNNKGGTSDVDDLENFVLNLRFANIEDAILLNYIDVIRGELETPITEIRDNIMTVTFIKEAIIKGTSNYGEDSDVVNYLPLKLIIKNTADLQLKDLDEKTLYLEIIKL